jgi:hypothetical protein
MPGMTQTLDVSLMRTLRMAVKSADQLEPSVMTDDRWRSLHAQAKRIADSKRRELKTDSTPPPRDPDALILAGRLVRKRWLKLTGFILTLDVLLVMITLLARAGVLPAVP